MSEPPRHHRAPPSNQRTTFSSIQQTMTDVDNLNLPSEAPLPTEGARAPQAVKGLVKLKPGPSPPPAAQSIGPTSRGGGAPRPRGGRKRGLIAKLFGFFGSCIKFLFTGTFGLFKITLWSVPQYAYRRYRGIRSTKMRRTVALGALLVFGSAAYFVWSGPTKGMWFAPKETCEFLARPAAKLYIDGKLASVEVPPIYRTRLTLGEHTIRFVSPNNREHEMSIEVVKGQSTQWFMNFVEGQIYQRSPNSGKGTK